jgi:hypothetical protein
LVRRLGAHAQYRAARGGARAEAGGLFDALVPGLRRIQPWGSPFMGWLRGSIREQVLQVEAGR